MSSVDDPAGAREHHADDGPHPSVYEDKADRLRLLLDITNQLVSNLELDALLRAISASVRSVMQCELVGVFLPDPTRNRIQTLALDFPGSKGLIREDLFTPMEGSLGGLVLSTGKPWAGNASDVRSLGLESEAAIPEGLSTGCVVPLISRRRILGLLGLGRREDRAFTEPDIHFLTQVANQIALAVENALAYREIQQLKDQLSQEKRYLEEEIRAEWNVADIVGSSTSLRKVLRRVETVAPTGSTVLIYGETGTGKELIARAIHDLSPRRTNAFVKLNCAAIPTGLLESELFGHEKGAFTGAVAQRTGRFEVANGGTIFLDEIGDLPVHAQVRLLRVLQNREIERVGATRTTKVDIRVIAATHRDLKAMIASGRFREDLWFRLNVFPIVIPPLRLRRDDVPALVRHFVEVKRRELGLPSAPAIVPGALARLQEYDWPGNVRELENLVEREIIRSGGAPLRFDEIGPTPEPRDEAPAPRRRPVRLDDVIVAHIESVLAMTGGKIHGPGGAAALLGVHENTLRTRMDRLGVVYGRRARASPRRAH